jgi:hypothetical protein
MFQVETAVCGVASALMVKLLSHGCEVQAI